MKYTALFNRSVMNMGIRLYKKLPTRMKQSDSFRDVIYSFLGNSPASEF